MSKLAITVKADVRFLKCQSITATNKENGNIETFTVASEKIFIGNDGLQLYVLCFKGSWLEAMGHTDGKLADYMCMVSVDDIMEVNGFDGYFTENIFRFMETEVGNGLLLSDGISYDDFTGIEKVIFGLSVLYREYEDDLDESWFCHCYDDVDYPVEGACDSVVLDEQEEKEIDAICAELDKEYNDRLLGMLVAVNSGDKELISKLSDAEVIFLEAIKK